ncbi:MAG TPA: OsmC family protein [Bacteroidia bacterium]|nr:OsmC family protein [Bacteroidota bacterium]HQW00387.1 OsmC family protein [Bacteroidia bacterium]
MTVDTKIQNQYKVSLDWDDNFDSVTVHAGVRSPLMIGPPPEFNGKESIWSPEHLLISSLSSCYTTTFMHFAKLLKAPIRKFHVEASVEFEREGSGPYEAKRFIVHPFIEFMNNPGENVIESLLAKAEKYCIISKSVKGEVIIEASVRLN